jgi:P27 family predicted phage terminase small subunit
MSATADRVDGTVVRLPQRPGSASRPSSSSSRSAPAEGRLKAPDWMSSSGRAVFRSIARHFEASAPGWLLTVDVELLALACEHLAVAKAASRAMRGPGGRYVVVGADAAHGGRERKHPAHQVFREATAAYVALARELGLTPKARAELEVGLGDAPDGADGDDADDGLLDA